MDFNISILLALILSTISFSVGQFVIEEQDNTVDGDLAQQSVIKVTLLKFKTIDI